MTLPTSTRARILPGFRFYPTDQELIYYLQKKVSLENSDLDCIIPAVDLNKFEPWDLCEFCNKDIMHQSEAYLFNHREKKFLIGKRTNRATNAGFWKATGRDKPIYSGCYCIGMKKTLVFYRGRALHSEKTEWIMHEYRLQNEHCGLASNEDGWVVCRVFKKHQVQGKSDQSCSSVLEEEQCGKIGNVDSSISSQLEFALSCALSCNEDVEDCPLQVPALKLPKLKSPKTKPACHTHMNLSKNLNKDHDVLEVAAFSLDDPSIKGYISDDDIGGYIDCGLWIDKNVSETLETDFPDLRHFTGDILLGQLSSEKLPSEGSSICEVQLWNGRVA